MEARPYKGETAMLITNDNRYIVLPVSKEADKTKLRISQDGKLMLDLDIKLDFRNPESTMYYDLVHFMGMDIEITNECGKELEFTSEKPMPEFGKYRPRMRYTADYGWINDPNGLVYYEGQYHLFYQHNPAGTEWGNMHWGHAVSEDTLHWEELEEALIPDEMGDMFSGSAIVDHKNLLGLNTDRHEALLLFYTAAGNHREIDKGKTFTQCLAYSTDGGYSFKKYENNPVVPHIKGGNRDPKVVYDDANGIYLMALYLDGTEYALLTSEDLVNWKHLQTFSLPGDDECPDIFKMDNGKDEKKWVIGGAHDMYTVCDFDPDVGFVSFTEPKKLGFGAVYAAQSYSETGERRLRFSWERFTKIPDNDFSGMLSVPCELKLFGSELRIKPADEFDNACETVEVSENLPSHGICRDVGRSSDITLELSHLEEAVTVILGGNEIKLDAMSGTVTVNGEGTMPLCPDNGKAKVRIIADNYGIELFTGISDGYAKAFGAFAGEIKDGTLTLRGEGSLDRIKINKF